jgi:hypothetical protein
MRVYISIEAQVGNLVVGLLTGDYDGQMKDVSGNGASLCMGAPTVELGGRSPLLEDPKGYIKEGSGNRYSFPLGNLEGKFNYRGLREVVKEGSGNGAYLSKGSL